MATSEMKWADAESDSTIPEIPREWMVTETRTGERAHELLKVPKKHNSRARTSVRTGDGASVRASNGDGASSSRNSDHEHHMSAMEPSRAQIYAALVASGAIKCDNPPPPEFKTGSIIQRGLWSAYHNNPRGINCASAVAATNICSRTMNMCYYAKIIAIIYKLTGHSLTREKIEAINFAEFCATYAKYISFMGVHWFGLYPLYENARLHVCSFSHRCVPSCAIMELAHNHDKCAKAEKSIQAQTEEHMRMYIHPALIRTFRAKTVIDKDAGSQKTSAISISAALKVAAQPTTEDAN